MTNDPWAIIIEIMVSFGSLLRCSENGYEENQEKFIRCVLKEFVYMENQLIQQMVRTLHKVKLVSDLLL